MSNPTKEFRQRVLAALKAHEGDLQAQADAASDVLWQVLEERCRGSYPWPPRQERRGERKPA